MLTQITIYFIDKKAEVEIQLDTNHDSTSIPTCMDNVNAIVQV